MKMILKNGQRIVKDNQLERIDIAIENGKIIEIGTDLTGDKIIHLDGKLITPGLVDVHVHFREPGFTDKETIKTGAQAAARGGYTTVCAMPNTNPVPDTKEKIEAIREIIKRDACIDVQTYAPITRGLKSDEIVRMDEVDAFAYTNDGVGVQDTGTMFLAMTQAAKYNRPIVAHTEEDSLLFGGVMHEGFKSRELGLPGIMGIVESAQIARDIQLAKETGVHYHVCHVSSKDSVAAIREGKRQGVHVTAEVAPHHLILNEGHIPSDDATYKMNPPLRSEEDQRALLEGFLDGTIDIIATDHAPHTEEEKEGGFLHAPFGIVGIETAFALLYTHFVKPGIFTLEFLINRMSTIPSRMFNLRQSDLRVGSAADLAVFDLDTAYTIAKKDYLSKSSNTPFNGKTVHGMCALTLYDGKVVWTNAN
ncbi:MULTISPECIES: dihydroorotase [unclassified Jeotgalibaca]|uniref:dihydroorotase n=1 Tax=unclassified Jeotgalibaca TaxID=2621505 RepID=UPI003FCF7557